MKNRMTWLFVLMMVACGPSVQFGRADSDRLIDVVHPDAYGVLVEVRHEDYAVYGELLGCVGGNIYLRTRADDRDLYLRLEDHDWNSIRILKTSVRAGASLWGVAGAFLTLSHGAFVIFSGPVWFVGGILGIATTGEITQPGRACETSLRQWARWPQGVPESVLPRFRAISNQGEIEYDVPLGASNGQPALPYRSLPAPW
jgi:hypothetical protein